MITDEVIDLHVFREITNAGFHEACGSSGGGL